MLDSTIESTRQLASEIWDVSGTEEPPALARFLGRCAERLHNIAIVSMYSVLVALGCYTIYQHAPPSWLTTASTKIWFWVGLVFVIVSALRCGLEITKWLKRWNIASLCGATLLFDTLLEKTPPLFGVEGFSLIESAFHGASPIIDLLRKANGL